MADSGTQALIGYTVESVDGKLQARLTVEDKHLNRALSLHGGIIATLLDVACGYEANGVLEPDAFEFLVTVSMTTNFLAAGRAGDELIATATQTGGGRSIKYVNGELRRLSDDRLIATASGIFRKTAMSVKKDK